MRKASKEPMVTAEGPRNMAAEEREQGKSRGAFYDLLPKVSGCHFCFALFTRRSMSSSPAPTQKEEK